METLIYRNFQEAVATDASVTVESYVKSISQDFPDFVFDDKLSTDMRLFRAAWINKDLITPDDAGYLAIIDGVKYRYSASQKKWLDTSKNTYTIFLPRCQNNFRVTLDPETKLR